MPGDVPARIFRFLFHVNPDSIRRARRRDFRFQVSWTGISSARDFVRLGPPHYPLAPLSVRGQTAGIHRHVSPLWLNRSLHA